MSHPFNFYEYPWSTSGEFITPFSSYFTGIYFPRVDVLVPKIPLLEDDSARPISLRTFFTGKVFDAPKDFEYVSIQISGDVFPSSPDTGNLSFAYTGQVLKDNIDSLIFDIPFSGAMSGEPLDILSFANVLTGIVSSGYNMLTVNAINYSGIIAGGFNETENFIIGFSGNFKRRPTDLAGVDVNLYSVEYAIGAAIIDIFVTDAGSIDFILNEVIFAPA